MGVARNKGQRRKEGGAVFCFFFRLSGFWALYLRKTFVSLWQVILFSFGARAQLGSGNLLMAGKGGITVSSRHDDILYS